MSPATQASPAPGMAPAHKVLIFGGGGREHALAWALAGSPRVGEMVCAPGNGGIAALARCVPVDINDLDALVALAVAEQPQMVVIGPEVPLALGLTDALQLRGLRVFGPTRAAAQLEASKGFAKRFMQRHAIPTPHYALCSSVEEAKGALALFSEPVVVKADGLHAGKGVTICATRADALHTVEQLFSGELLGRREAAVLLEEHLSGEELSLLVLCDGRHAAPMAPARDHKRIGDGDTGPNTGGMGVYSVDSMLSPAMLEWILHHIVQPTLDGMAEEATPFAGTLFLGLMMTPRGPMVLEYNTRFGDPETEAVLLRLQSDLYEAFEAVVEGRLSEAEFRWRSGASATVVAASAGYPGSYTTGHAITGLDEAATVPGAVIFHASTRVDPDGTCRTAGGRVLAVSAAADSLEQALDAAYAAIAKIGFEGIYYRRDIGRRVPRP